ncbi:MAG TPA: hypothetical protein VHN99_11200, partial [Deinococcales bacterium]|nr:hypothetical protein [Deinococcales bacterium]
PSTGKIHTLVAALYCVKSNCDLSPAEPFNYDKSVADQVDQTADRTPYVLQNVPVGSFIVAGWQDLNGNSQVDSGEPFGFYPEIVTVTAGKNSGGVDVQLQAYSASATSKVRAAVNALQARAR